MAQGVQPLPVPFKAHIALAQHQRGRAHAIGSQQAQRTAPRPGGDAVALRHGLGGGLPHDALRGTERGVQRLGHGAGAVEPGPHVAGEGGGLLAPEIPVQGGVEELPAVALLRLRALVGRQELQQGPASRQHALQRDRAQANLNA